MPINTTKYKRIFKELLSHKIQIALSVIIMISFYNCGAIRIELINSNDGVLIKDNYKFESCLIYYGDHYFRYLTRLTSPADTNITAHPDSINIYCKNRHVTLKSARKSVKDSSFYAEWSFRPVGMTYNDTAFIDIKNVFHNKEGSIELPVFYFIYNDDFSWKLKSHKKGRKYFNKWRTRNSNERR